MMPRRRTRFGPGLAPGSQIFAAGVGFFAAPSSGPPVYATLSPTDKAAGVTLSGGNLTASGCNYLNAVRATQGVSAGKWYWEIKGISPFRGLIGVANSSELITTYPGNTSNGWGYGEAGYKYNAGVATAYGSTWTASSDVIGVALNMDAGTITVYKNGVSMGLMFSGLTGTVYPMLAGDTAASAGALTCNFGATAFAYTPPAGFNAGLYQ